MRDCADCGHQVVAEVGPVEIYIVHDDVWEAAGLGRGYLCVPCLEGRLGRPLTGADFPTDIPANRPGLMRDTPRLHQLKVDAHRVTPRA